MKSPEELQRYYEQELLNDLKELEGRRKKTFMSLAAYTILILVASLALTAVIAAFIMFSDDCAGCCMISIPVLLIAMLVVWVVGCGRIKDGYVKNFKSQIMPKLVKFIDENLEYAHNKSIPQSVFSKSKIFLTHPDIYSGEDYVSGTVGKTRIEFSEVHAQDKQEYTDSKGRRHTRYVTIFKGILFVADFNKDFSEQTLVLPDTAEKTFGKMIGSFLQKHNISRPPLVKLEDPEFEKHFVVYGKDQVQSRYVLSTSLMNRIMEFRKKMDKSVFLSFVDNNVIVAVPYSKNLFEPRLFKSIVDFKQVEGYYQDLKLLLDIVEDLNLNTRIWTKK